MTIVLFLIDTSGSMNQRTHNGARSTLLDITKETVEKFIKIRQHSPVARGDRYMLLTFDEVPYNVKAGWKENHTVFMNELKNLTAVGMTTFGCALKNAFDYLNINRMQTGIDTYGQGRCPYYLEAAIIVAITDGAKYTTVNNVQHELNLPMNTHSPGAEFTLEPFRWDQRLFSIVLRLTGTYNGDTPAVPVNNNNNTDNSGYLVPYDDSPINAMCEVTGGRSYCVTSQKSLNASVEQLLSRMHIGVMIRFEKFGPDPPMIITSEEDSSDSNKSVNSFDPNNRSWTNCRNLIYVRSGQKGYSFGNWPIPEAYCPDLVNPNIQPRTAHPIVKFTCSNSEPAVINNLPFDKYELDPSPLTQFILSRKQPNVAWQVYISNSQRNSEFGHPFGYLKASTNLTCVNLFVLPYNYPALLPLLDELIKIHQGKPTREWRQQFDNYLKGMPIYYSITLRRAIQRMTSNATHGLVPENLDVYTTVTLNNLIKKHKNMAKLEFDKMAAAVCSQRHLNIEWPRITNSHLFSALHHNRKSNIVDFYCSNPQLKRIFAGSQNDHQDFNGFIVRYRDKPNSDSKTLCYRNPFDIERHELIDQLNKLRYNFFQKRTSLFKYQDEDQLHNLPVSQMGNYQEYVKRFPLPLREIEAAPTRQHMFGNPFKLDKKNVMVIDEADFDMPNGGNGNSTRGSKRPVSPSDALGSKPKRKPGPLPKDFQYFKFLARSPPQSPNSYSSINNAPPFVPDSSLYSHSSNSSSFLVPLSVINNKSLPPSTHQPNGNYYSYVKPNHPNLVANNVNNNISQISSNKVPQMNYVHSNNSATVNMNQNLVINSTSAVPISKPLVNINSINPPTITNGLIPANKSDKLNAPNQAKQNGIPSNYSLIWINLFRRKNFTNDEYGKKRHLMKLVRRPGQDHSELLQYLSSIEGQFGEYLLHEVVLEASRFKRKSLICSLSDCFGPKVEKILQLNKDG